MKRVGQELLYNFILGFCVCSAVINVMPTGNAALSNPVSTLQL